VEEEIMSEESRFTDYEYANNYELKKKALEKVLGKMYRFVGHSIVSFDAGGPIDTYYFPNANDGTCIASMELLDPDGSGPMPSQIGTYELVAFTKLKITDETTKDKFRVVDQQLRTILSKIGHYSFEAKLNPKETVEVPFGDDKPTRYVILDEYKKSNVDFMIGRKKHGLLLVVEVFKSEMEYAMTNGGQVLLDKLKEKGFYPFSDLDREPVF
jgi:hypothetical protein